MNITLNVNVAPELISALQSIAAALTPVQVKGPVHEQLTIFTGGQTGVEPVIATTPDTVPAYPVANSTGTPPAVAPVIHSAVPTTPAAPVAQTPVTADPIATQQGTPAGVPTTAQTYSMEQLAVAATQLVDAGRRNELVGLLASFGVQALTELPKEQYGAFATQLRGMGAKI